MIFKREAQYMSSLKTFLVCLCLALFLPATARTSENLFEVFAGCAGRLSAEMEHAWLMGDPEASTLEHQRLTFISLLEATQPEDAAHRALTHRIEHKMAQASLLTIATFGVDTRRARIAHAPALTFRHKCEPLLLDG